MKNVVFFLFFAFLMLFFTFSAVYAAENGQDVNDISSTETVTADSAAQTDNAAAKDKKMPVSPAASENAPVSAAETASSAENAVPYADSSLENDIKKESKEEKPKAENSENKKTEGEEKKEPKKAKKDANSAVKAKKTPNETKKTANPSEKKAESQQTKPRKYTGDKWELKISTEEVKAAVDTKPAIRGVHITAWVAGSEPLRRKIIENIKGTVLNTVVIALKEMDGAVYIKGVEKAEKYKAYTSAIANPEKMVEDFKREGLYTIGRIVLFKDDVLPVKRPDLAVKTPEGNIWRDRKGKTWADQYSREVWDYNIAVALRAVEAGFDEIQFDYIRYPSEGKVSLCRYSVPHSWDKARANLAEFLRYAKERIPEQIRISADVFGLTTSARDDMGIGQNLPLLAQYADYVYPMMYPSHYYPGHYGLKNPNSEPYKVINYGLRDAMARLELNYAKLRPYLQDFSKYGTHEVGEQIRALRKNYLHSWVMWSPNNKYTWEAYRPEYYKKYIDPDYEP